MIKLIYGRSSVINHLPNNELNVQVSDTTGDEQ